MSKKEIKANWVDNFVGIFSPKRKFDRVRLRMGAEIIVRRYEAASRSRRTEGWCAGSSAADKEIASSLTVLRDRSRQLVRDNPYASRAIQVITNNVVGGRGIMTQIKYSKEATQLKIKKINEVWRAWAMSPACDWDGRNSMTGLQQLVMRTMVESGEVLVRVRRTPRMEAEGPEGRKVEVPPIQIQVMEADFLDTTKQSTSLDNGNKLIQGVELDTKTGKPVAYHLFEDHPGALLPTGMSLKSNRIPASEVLHIYRMDRPGQIRGVPWLAPVMIRLKDFDKYEDAQLVRQMTAAMFAGFIHDTEAMESGLSETEKEYELGEKLEPGIMEILPPGKDIKFSSPPEVREYSQYSACMLRGVASGMGITYESLTGDLSQVNFSSARMGFLEMSRNIESWRWQLFVPQFQGGVMNWFMTGAALIGLSTEDAYPVYSAPRREMIDPTKEVPAIKDAIRSGIMTLSEAVRQTGNDVDKHFEEYKQDMDRLDELELTLDTDPRKDPKQIAAAPV